MTVGTARLTVYQSPASRGADFNSVGSVDLLWYNVADGRVSTWLMRGTQLLDGTLLNPGQVADVNWAPVAIGDRNRNGRPDIIWQLPKSSAKAYAEPLGPGQVMDVNLYP